MSAAEPTAEELAALREAGRAAVLRRWCSGHSLTVVEMAAVSDLLPPAVLANPPRRRSGYREELDYYAKALGYDVRSIKRLTGLGKLAGLPCPLDDLGRIADWWDEMKVRGFIKQAVPHRVLEAAGRIASPAEPVTDAALLGPGTAAVAPAAPPTAALPAVPAAPVAGTKINVDDLRSVGLAEAVKELSLQLAADQQELRTARVAGMSEGVVSRRQKTYNTTLESLRKTEESLLKLQEARGELVALADVRADLTTLLTTLRGMRRKLADNICEKLAGDFTAEQLGKLRGALAFEAAREETQLRTAKHWKRGPDGSVIE
jgi:hypothetical protein